MVCCVRKLLLTLVDVEETSLLPNSTSGRVWYFTGNIPKYADHHEAAVGNASSMRIERLHVIQSNFDKKMLACFLFPHRNWFWYLHSSETFSLHVSKTPSLGSFIFVQHSGGMLCPSGLAMEFDTFLLGFWNQLCEHTTLYWLMTMGSLPTLLRQPLLETLNSEQTLWQTDRKKPPTQVI